MDTYLNSLLLHYKTLINARTYITQQRDVTITTGPQLRHTKQRVNHHGDHYRLYQESHTWFQIITLLWKKKIITQKQRRMIVTL